MVINSIVFPKLTKDVRNVTYLFNYKANAVYFTTYVSIQFLCSSRLFSGLL